MHFTWMKMHFFLPIIVIDSFAFGKLSDLINSNSFREQDLGINMDLTNLWCTQKVPNWYCRKSISYCPWFFDMFCIYTYFDTLVYTPPDFFSCQFNFNIYLCSVGITVWLFSKIQGDSKVATFQKEAIFALKRHFPNFSIVQIFYECDIFRSCNHVFLS